MKNKTIQSVIVVSVIIVCTFVHTGMAMTLEFARMEGMILARLLNPLSHLNVNNEPQSFDTVSSDTPSVSMEHDTEQSITENQKMNPISNVSNKVPDTLRRPSFEDQFSMLSKPVSHRRHRTRK